MNKQAPLLRRPPQSEMTGEQRRSWMRAALQQKMQRARTYPERRAARGTHTPTDDAYEADQRRAWFHAMEARL